MVGMVWYHITWIGETGQLCADVSHEPINPVLNQTRDRVLIFGGKREATQTTNEWIRQHAVSAPFTHFEELCHLPPFTGHTLPVPSCSGDYWPISSDENPRRPGKRACSSVSSPLPYHTGCVHTPLLQGLHDTLSLSLYQPTLVPGSDLCLFVC